jgi:hypothetical protein
MIGRLEPTVSDSAFVNTAVHASKPLPKNLPTAKALFTPSS